MRKSLMLSMNCNCHFRIVHNQLQYYTVHAISETTNSYFKLSMKNCNTTSLICICFNKSLNFWCPKTRIAEFVYCLLFHCMNIKESKLFNIK